MSYKIGVTVVQQFQEKERELVYPRTGLYKHLARQISWS